MERLVKFSQGNCCPMMICQTFMSTKIGQNMYLWRTVLWKFLRNDCYSDDFEKRSLKCINSSIVKYKNVLLKF